MGTETEDDSVLELRERLELAERTVAELRDCAGCDGDSCTVIAVMNQVNAMMCEVLPGTGGCLARARALVERLSDAEGRDITDREKYNSEVQSGGPEPAEESSLTRAMHKLGNIGADRSLDIEVFRLSVHLLRALDDAGIKPDRIVDTVECDVALWFKFSAKKVRVEVSKDGYLASILSPTENRYLPGCELGDIVGVLERMRNDEL